MSTKDFNKKLNKEKTTSQIDFKLGEFLSQFDDRYAIKLSKDLQAEFTATF